MANLDIQRTRDLLQGFEFRKLFLEELGWNGHSALYDIPVDGHVYHLKAIAEKSGVQAFECSPDGDGAMPAYSDRQKLDRQLAKLAFEHLIIFTDPKKTEQIWQWVSRERGKPAAYREYKFYKGQAGETIVQKLDTIAFSINEEETITVTGVTGKLKDAFDRDRVTKKFYDRFKTEHDAFLKFIQGIPEESLRKWYASVMINRLMFVYFIQKKGFLDGDRDYLQNKLKESKKEGKDRYYSDFLCTLFFEGFAKEQSDRSKATNKLLGNIPYLNGGLFLKHDIEKRHGKDIQIHDSAFQKLFSFFDDYEWHLDARPLANDKEINPDVLGYIFEKYINQKELGAYYTKEDITEYISKNTIIPYLFDFAKTKCKIAFEGENSVWGLLKDSPDTYIYEPVKRGAVDQDGNVIPESRLPDFVQKGMHDPKARMVEKRYNLGEADFRDEAGKRLTLPTETWREYVERRNRCLDVRRKLQSGEVREINDLITYNLDIRQFAQDVIESSEGPDLLNAFWNGIKDVKILDPTVGSGAFLFAALNILEPLYEASLDRMQIFLDEWGESAKKLHPNYYKEFTVVLDNVEMHANREYFIYKSIIINNLYGVDILDEAVEICKLRLFLKLAAQVEPDASKPNYGIEPLPDIDFNVRAGNTLVGYTSLDEIKRAIPADLMSNASMNESLKRIEEKAADIEKLFNLFRQQQTEIGGEVTPADKEDLQKRLRLLEGELNRYLAGEYGVDPNKKPQYEKWLVSHKPFHWYIEFLGIVRGGGFDVTIGNPPYVEVSDVAKQYALKNFLTLKTGNLFSFCTERSTELTKSHGKLGFIVPISSVSTPRMLPLMRLLGSHFNPLFLSSFAVRPGKLFTGTDMNLTIMVGSKSYSRENREVFSTTYIRWYGNYRRYLFNTLRYGSSFLDESLGTIPKICGGSPHLLLTTIAKAETLRAIRAKSDDLETIFYHSGGRYFRKCIREKLSNEYKQLDLQVGWADQVLCFLSSSLYYWYWISISDCFHVTSRDVDDVAIPSSLRSEQGFSELSQKLLTNLWSNAQKRIRRRADGRVQEEVNFNVGLSKSVLDEIDLLLAKHYGFTDEELDFIINYDIKYRMGNEASPDEDE